MFLVGGQADLKVRLIRAIGDPEKRFDEDRLRMLRAARFAAQIDFEIEPATLAAISRRSAEISSVSRERVKEELGKLLSAKGAGRGLRLLQSTGLLAACVPGIFDTWMTLRRDYGTLRVADLRAPPIGYAQHGYPLVDRMNSTRYNVTAQVRPHWPTADSLYMPATERGALREPGYTYT